MCRNTHPLFILRIGHIQKFELCFEHFQTRHRITHRMRLGNGMTIQIGYFHGSREIVIQLHGRRIRSHSKGHINHLIGKRCIDVLNPKCLCSPYHLHHLAMNEFTRCGVSQQMITCSLQCHDNHIGLGISAVLL